MRGEYKNMKNKIWITKNGDEIEISKMDDQHLLNTIKMLEKQAEEGVVEVNGSSDYYGTDGDKEFLQGQDYLNSIKEYSWLKEEAEKRKLNN